MAGSYSFAAFKAFLKLRRVDRKYVGCNKRAAGNSFDSDSDEWVGLYEPGPDEWGWPCQPGIDDMTSLNKSRDPDLYYHEPFMSRSDETEDEREDETHQYELMPQKASTRKRKSRGSRVLSVDDPSKLFVSQPATKFRDALDFKHSGTVTLSGIDQSCKYKNNLTAVITNCADGTDYLVVCMRLEIVLYGFSLLLPEMEPLLRFDTRPPFTLNTDRLVLTWPYYPHTINLIKTTEDWVNGGAIGVCTDDGSILVFHHQTLFDRIKSPNDTRLKPDFRLKFDYSAWSVDFGKSRDATGNIHHILVASANSQAVSLHYLKDNRFYGVYSHQLSHNIPEATIVAYDIKLSLPCDFHHEVTVICLCISNELVLFKFEFSTNESVLLKVPTVINRSLLSSDCWTSKPVNARAFKPVNSLSEATGDFKISSNELDRMEKEAEIMLGKADVKEAAAWQHFDCPVARSSKLKLTPSKGPLVSVDETYRRLHKTFKWRFGSNGDTTREPLRNTLIAVTTESRAGLFRADLLLCCSSTQRVFNENLPETFHSSRCGRLSLSVVVPELQCFIVVSQQGLALIMRMCSCQGVFAMRQEHVFPNAASVVIGADNVRTVIGVCVRLRSVLAQIPRYCLYLVFSDGLVLAYDLLDPCNTDLEPLIIDGNID